MIITKFRNGVIEHKEQVQLALLHALQSIATAKTESVRTPNLQTFVGNTYGDDTDSFVNELSKMIGRPSTDGVSLNKEQITNLLMSKTTKQKVKIITECIQAGYREMIPVLPRDTIYFFQRTALACPSAQASPGNNASWVIRSLSSPQAHLNWLEYRSI